MQYEPKQGDIIWLTLDPQAGHEQMGRRPVLVVSNNTFNSLTRTGSMICPITNTSRGLHIQPQLDSRTKTTGFIMCDQAKILDLSKRNAEFIEKAPDDIVFEAVDIITGFIEIED